MTLAILPDHSAHWYSIPIFSEDEEQVNGIPKNVQNFLQKTDSHDGLVISLVEHNRSYTAAFKNLYDWASRVRYEVWGGKPMLILATSPGCRGGANVLAAAKATFPHMGADLRGSFSLPSFEKNFSSEKGALNDQLMNSLGEEIVKWL